jgi:two-component system, OmpR family, phosphate regulon sensor histidine kinase PhoR
MVWPVLTVLALAALVAVHVWWSRRLTAAQVAARRELERLKQLQEEAAAQIHHQQEALFDSMAEGLLLLDSDGRVQLANHAFHHLFGVARNIRSQTIMEALRLHELAELVDFLGKQKQVLGYELKLSRPAERWVQINGAALFNGQGRRSGTVLVFHDLTRLKQLEGTRQEFVANVSHELRTPLSLIKGYVETLLDGARDNPELALKFLRTIERNAERLKLLIEDLLTISELESGRVKLNLQSVPVQTVVEKVLGDYKTRADARNVRLVDATPDLRVRADAVRLEQVLGNLVDNAIKYGRTEGTVEVSARLLEDGLVEVAVEDDGPGIPPDALERVFERFYRVDKARSREQGGTGLGLAIVKHIVQTHGGKAWVSSQPGQGARFCFTLPRDPGGLQQPLL